MDCCICNEEWTHKEYEELSDDEKAQTNTCKVCDSFICIRCREEWGNTLDNKSKRFECPVCRTMDWKHYFSEDILWYIKHKSLDCSYIDEGLYYKYIQSGEMAGPPILYYIDKYMNSNCEIDDC